MPIDPGGGPNPLFRAAAPGDLKSVLAVVAGQLIAVGSMPLLTWLRGGFK
jgi:hypothetical protein